MENGKECPTQIKKTIQLKNNSELTRELKIYSKCCFNCLLYKYFNIFFQNYALQAHVNRGCIAILCSNNIKNATL